jgi:hypothetical protein
MNSKSRTVEDTGRHHDTGRKTVDEPINEEGWTASQKSGFMSRVVTASVALGVLAVGGIVVGYLMNKVAMAYLCLLVVSAVVLLYAGLVYE